jgi:hypothetical protein
VSNSLLNFGIGLGGGQARGGMIQPKPKHRFRVRVIGFGPVAGGLELTRQVETVGRPQVQSNAVEVHSYNSVAYYAGKAIWQPVSLTVRDDITNAVSRLVGHQEQKQLNHFTQTQALAGSNYKFEAFIETLDGGDDGVLETWHLEGCWLESIEYGEFDYKTSDPLTIQMSIRYDNATQEGGLMPLAPQIGSGPMMTG